MFNSFKDKVLSKSGQFNYYKSNFEELTKNNPQLMEAKDNEVIKELLSTARTFSNWKYIDYFFKDDFDEKFHEYLKNMSPESKKRFKLGFIRAIMGAYTYQNSLFSQEEMELNVKIQKFIEENVSDNKICDFNIIPGHYNINCFMDDYLTDSDKFFLKDKDIIDAGAFIGDSALPLSKLTSKNVYAFEPFDESFATMEENIKLNNIDNIIPVKASLTDKNEDITLYLSGNNVEGITSNSSIRKYDTELVVKGMTIDKFVEENNLDVGFIKIDVEGGEQALLRGAINTIKTQKPIIYVSIYHTAEDFFNIKPWIESLDLGYEFEISKEKPYHFITDTVLECRVPKSKLHYNSINYDIINQNYEFSVVMAIYNTEKYLNESIDSIINQTIGFEDNIELILVDDGSTDNSGEICKQYQEKYPNNIKYIYQENQGQANARNNGLKFTNGQLINFLDSDDKFSLETFENVYNLFKDNLGLSVVSVPIKFFDRLTGDHPLNYKYDETKVVDLLEEYKFIQLQISSSFIRSDLIKKYSFNEDLIISEDALILNQIFLDNPKLGVIKDVAYMYRKRSDLSSTIDKSTLDKDYYIHRTEVYFKGLIKESIEKYGFVTKFIQFLIMYELQWLLRIEEIDTILTDEEVSWLYSTLKNDVLKFIDNEIILGQGQSDMSLLNSAFIFKYDDMRFDTYQGLCRVWSGDKIIDKLNDHKFYIDSLEIKNGNFIIIGFLKSFFNPEDLTIELVKSNLDDVEIFKAKEVKYSKKDRKYIGKLFNKLFNFEIKVPLEKIENSKSNLRVRFKDINLYLNFVFMDSVNLSFESNYFLKDNYLLKFEDNQFIINNFEFSLFENYEKENIKKLESLDSNIALDNIIELRKTYLSNFNGFNNKNIYLFMDRQEKADDNAEILYKYAINQEDNINKYFVISEESSDYDRLELELSGSDSNIIPFGSNKHKLLYLFANKIISFHPDDEILNPFYGENNKYIAGLLTLEKYFIQHGIILHDISSWLKRYEKHLSLFLTTSKREYNSIFEYDYNYDKDTVQLLGLPRFDALKNEDKKTNCDYAYLEKKFKWY